MLFRLHAELAALLMFGPVAMAWKSGDFCEHRRRLELNDTWKAKNAIFAYLIFVLIQHFAESIRYYSISAF